MYQHNELTHHGILGQKWGVRRYQNYDGTYTQRGLERYRKAQAKYESAKEAYKTGTGSRRDMKTAKKAMSNAYDKLVLDNKADEGKKLYKQGKTITSNTRNTQIAETAIVVGSAVANNLIASKTGDQKLANISSATLAVGGTAVNAILAIKTENENAKIRAYYAH